MKTLGIDIGTTTISAAVLEDGQFLASETRANGAFISSALACAREQDAEKITQTALSVVQMLFERYPDIHSIGVTGQMHSILYVDADGNAVSPLYTWQDARGSLPHSKTESWVQYLTRETGYLAAAGYGLVTHAYNLAAGLVPPAAVTCCTIGDYLAMRLCGLLRRAWMPATPQASAFSTRNAVLSTKTLCKKPVSTRALSRSLPPIR